MPEASGRKAAARSAWPPGRPEIAPGERQKRRPPGGGLPSSREAKRLRESISRPDDCGDARLADRPKAAKPSAPNRPASSPRSPPRAPGSAADRSPEPPARRSTRRRPAGSCTCWSPSPGVGRDGRCRRRRPVGSDDPAPPIVSVIPSSCATVERLAVCHRHHARELEERAVHGQLFPVAPLEYGNARRVAGHQPAVKRII